MDFDDPRDHSRQWDGVPNWVAGLVVIFAILAVPAVIVFGLAISLVTSSPEHSAYGTCETTTQSDRDLITRTVLDVLPANTAREATFAGDFDGDCEMGPTDLTARWAHDREDAAIEILERQGWRRAPNTARPLLTTTIDDTELKLWIEQDTLRVKAQGSWED